MSERYSARMSARYKSSGSATRSSRIERDRGQRTEDRGSWVKSVRGFLGQFSMHRHLGDVVESPTLHAGSSIFEALNLGPEHVCGMRTYDPMTDMLARECDRPAHWFRVCGRCGVDGFACNPCRRWAIVSGSCRGCKPGHAWVAEAWHWRPL